MKTVQYVGCKTQIKYKHMYIHVHIARRVIIIHVLPLRQA